MNTARRSLPYVRQYVIVAIYEVLEQLCAPYEKTDASTILSEIPVYGNKSVFSISVSEQAEGTQMLVTMVRPCTGLSEDGVQRAVTAVADRISQYLKMKRYWWALRPKNQEYEPDGSGRKMENTEAYL